MKFETLKTRKLSTYKRSILTVSCISLVLLLTLTLYFSFAKYRVTQTIKLVEGKVVKVKVDPLSVEVYLGAGEKKVANIPSKASGYQFDRLSCTGDYNSAEFDTDSWQLNVEATDTTVCKVYFTYDLKFTIANSMPANRGDDVNITVTSQETLSEHNFVSYNYKMDNNAWVGESTSNPKVFSGLSWTGYHRVYVTVKDTMTNETMKDMQFFLDKEAPSLSITASSTSSKNNTTTTWHKTYSATIGATDLDNSIAAFKYCTTVGANATCTPSTVVSGTSNDANGTVKTLSTTTAAFSNNASVQRVCMEATDAMGNATEVKCFDAAYVDGEAPTASVSATPSGNSATFTITASDSYSGGLTYQYKLDSATNWTSLGTTTSKTLTSLANGDHRITVRVTDAAGNYKDATASFKIDNEAPSVSIAASSDSSKNNTTTTWYKTYKAVLTATDGYNSVKSFKYCITSGANATCTPDTAVSGTSNDANGTKKTVSTTTAAFSNNASIQRVCMEAIDYVGNTSGVVCKDAAYVDGAVPTVSVAATPSNSDVTFTITASDDHSKGLTYQYKVDSGSFTSLGTTTSKKLTGLTNGDHTITIRATDAAGNYKDASKTFTITIKAVNTIIANKTVNASTGGMFNVPDGTETTGVLYEAEDDYGTSYYYRGAPTDNWVQFGTDTEKNLPIWWRIIRINGDGTIRMIYAGTGATAPNTTGEGTQIGKSKFNTSYKNNMYVGYFYTENEVHGLGTASTIYEEVNDWYSKATRTNLASLQNDYIDEEAGFCNDRMPYSSKAGAAPTDQSGKGTTTTYYAAYIRLLSDGSSPTSSSRTITPTFKCEDKTNDLFTYSGATQGNHKLEYPVGLITADEVSYAGMIGGSETRTNYLYTRESFWTMSPYYYDYYVSVFVVIFTGSLENRSVIDENGVRPVINLKSSVTLVGSGTREIPYTVS